MFAFIKRSFGTVTLLTAVVCWWSMATLPVAAQQPQQPSQRYQPLRNVPPTVHVPSVTTQRLPKVKSTVPIIHRQPELNRLNPNLPQTPVGNNSDSPSKAEVSFTERQVNFDETVNNDGDNPSVPKLLEATGTSLIAKQETFSRINQSTPSTANIPAPSLGPTSNSLPGNTINQPPARPSFQSKQPPITQPSSSGSDDSGDNGFALRQTNTDTKRRPGIISLSSQETQPSGRSTTLPVSSATNFPLARTTDTTAVSGFEKQHEAMFESSAPSIRIQSFGPKTVGINKASSFQVHVSNSSSETAENVLVGIHLPQWVDVRDLQSSTGLFKITDGVEQPRVVWTVDRIPGNSTQTITIPATPRKAELFDLGVEWTLIPRTAKSSVEVTQPKLEMTVSGPDDILYGDKAVYQVEIRNPGTGTAEQVVVKLPEALGGESQPIGDITPGESQRFQIELFALTAGELDLLATASAAGDLSTSVQRKVRVRRANLEVKLTGPARKYAGTDAKYSVTVTNRGDALAQGVIAAVALPSGVEYMGGLDSADQTPTGLTWNVGSMKPGDSETYNLNFVLNTSGDLQLEVGARGDGDLAAASQCVTTVQTVADLTLNVVDPRGPLPTGEDVTYELRIKNRGSKAATNIDVVMHFADGIEPTSAKGMKNQVTTGEVAFEPIPVIQPGQELVLTVVAQAEKSGTHVFRAQLSCDDSDSSEIAQGTTRFYGETVKLPPKTSATNRTANDLQPTGQTKK